MANELRFRRLRLRNWKNFRDMDVEVRNRMFLVGANAAGKSNLLDAFRFLRDLASVGGGFEEAVTRRGGVKAIRSLAARRNTDIEIKVEVEKRDGHRWRYELAFGEDGQRRPQLCKEQVWRNGEVIVARPDKEDDKDPARLTQTHIEQVNVNRRFRDLAAFFASVRYLHVVPQLVREPDRSVGRANDPYGGDFLEQVAKTPERTRNARLKRVERALRVAVPQLEEIALARDDRGVPHLRGRYRHWRPHGAWQTEEQFSDGTLRLMGLLWAIMEKGGPLLLEEPELSLHPEIVRVLPQTLMRVQRRTAKQLFLSTHSPELLADEGIGLDETLLFFPETEGTKVVPAASFDDVHALLEGGLDLGDAVIPKTRPPKVRELSLFTGD